MCTCRGAAFSTPPVICELQLLHSKSYRSTGILIHRKNSYAPGSRQCAGRREAQRLEPVNKDKNPVLHKSRNLSLQFLTNEILLSNIIAVWTNYTCMKDKLVDCWAKRLPPLVNSVRLITSAVDSLRNVRLCEHNLFITRNYRYSALSQIVRTFARSHFKSLSRTNKT